MLSYWQNIIWALTIEISNNAVCAASTGLDKPARMRRLIRAFASRLIILWILSYWPDIIWSFLALKEAALSLQLPKCHIVGNHMRLNTVDEEIEKMLCLSNSQQIIVHLCKSNIIFPFFTMLTLSFTTAWFCNLFSSALSSAWSSTIRKITF